MGRGGKSHSLPRSPRQAVNLHHDIGLRLIKMANVAMITLPFILCWVLYYIHTVLMYPSNIRASGIVLMFVVLYSFFGKAYDAYLVSLKRVSEMFYAQALSILFADGFMYLVLWLMSNAFPNIWPAMAALAGQLSLALLWCWAANKWYFANYARQKTGIVYDMRHDVEYLIHRYGMNQKFDVCMTSTVDECLEGRMKALDKLTSVFLCGVHSHERNIILKYCMANGIVVYVIPRVGDVIMSGARKIHMFHLPIMRVDRYNPPLEHVVAKRTLDIAMSLLLLLLFSPFMLATAVCIKLEDRGPIFYRQKRLTKDGREFDMLKFRSMVVSAEQDGVACLSSGAADPRVTRVGRFIRSCRIDEFPQLFNVLRGDMSLVGPRPERPEIAAEYEKEMPEFALRLQARAGLTGYAQVYGKYNTTPYDKLQMDLMYISRPSILEDVKILFATLPILFQRESTEGIEPGQVIAGENDKPAA
ncbi:MAG: exopolysaccharide biosynthesis polyprenyl glycosylphosphotransferase [Clostridia bacterium]|nr:exopolysaccharide biosynthesis polyprenyl glycosylphosphotransferase [Clostridia bacterium]